MKKIMVGIIVCLSVNYTNMVYASSWHQIVGAVLKLYDVQLASLNYQGESVLVQKDILSNQKQIEQLMQQVNQDLSGHYGWGEYQFHDYQSYGASANDWASVLRIAKSGQGTGDLAKTMMALGNQFPANVQAYNHVVSDEQSQNYYALKTQTVLATRAASELEYNKIHEQIAYQQMLLAQIEKTNDLKSAVDLSNRIHVEGNLINLEILRLTALANQQQALTEQGEASGVLANAKFLSHPIKE